MPKSKTTLHERLERFMLDKFKAFDRPNKTGETYRWFFCHDFMGEDIADDCACCFGYRPENKGCGCVCHFRIRQLEDFIKSELKRKS